jgi:hypothetical protein
MEKIACFASCKYFPGLSAFKLSHKTYTWFVSCGATKDYFLHVLGYYDFEMPYLRQI